jgi:hypothetical protein
MHSTMAGVAYVIMTVNYAPKMLIKIWPAAEAQWRGNGRNVYYKICLEKLENFRN